MYDVGVHVTESQTKKSKLMKDWMPSFKFIASILSGSFIKIEVAVCVLHSTNECALTYSKLWGSFLKFKLSLNFT